ncbi:PspC domain-containing protein [Psychrosphaera algicola]|uniref:PspC domain-containing protein n=1 Tax=Psychrosphaera algicola TaxID=3023714 RepID=A0ABT5FDM5_9GAMM|nr:PspC domain-containing protein [Psychrosphaera sp. G1-22]MDC2889613.1 PspC domain-containing protein [Psychrosphaera sp. G1-22]
MKSEYLGKPLAKDYLNRKLSGVCAGIAAHYGQPTIVSSGGNNWVWFVFPRSCNLWLFIGGYFDANKTLLGGHSHEIINESNFGIFSIEYILAYEPI